MWRLVIRVRAFQGKKKEKIEIFVSFWGATLKSKDRKPATQACQVLGPFASWRAEIYLDRKVQESLLKDKNLISLNEFHKEDKSFA